MVGEDLWIVNVFLKKRWLLVLYNIPLWDVLSCQRFLTVLEKMFEQGILDHMVWTVSKLHEGQFGGHRILGSKKNINITSGVRPGCVLMVSSALC